MIELTEISNGLFKDPDYNILKSDDFWKLPQNILTHFDKLDKGLHEVVYFHEEIMHFDGKEYPGIHMMTGPNKEAYFQKHFIDFIKEQGEPRFFIVRNDGFLLVEVEDVYFVVAPFLPEQYVEDFQR